MFLNAPNRSYGLRERARQHCGRIEVCAILFLMRFYDICVEKLSLKANGERSENGKEIVHLQTERHLGFRSVERFSGRVSANSVMIRSRKCQVLFCPRTLANQRPQLAPVPPEATKSSRIAVWKSSCFHSSSNNLTCSSVSFVFCSRYSNGFRPPYPITIALSLAATTLPTSSCGFRPNADMIFVSHWRWYFW